MGLLKLLINDPSTFILLAIPLLYSVILHELAHGWVAYRMGDSTAKWQGRLSLKSAKASRSYWHTHAFSFRLRLGEARACKFQ